MMHVGIANAWWCRNRSRHSWRTRNPQFYISGKRPISVAWLNSSWIQSMPSDMLVACSQPAMLYITKLGPPYLHDAAPVNELHPNICNSNYDFLRLLWWVTLVICPLKTHRHIESHRNFALGVVDWNARVDNCSNLHVITSRQSVAACTFMLSFFMGISAEEFNISAHGLTNTHPTYHT